MTLGSISKSVISSTLGWTEVAPECHPASQTNHKNFFRVFIQEHGQMTEGKQVLLRLQMGGGFNSTIRNETIVPLPLS